MLAILINYNNIALGKKFNKLYFDVLIAFDGNNKLWSLLFIEIFLDSY